MSSKTLVPAMAAMLALCKFDLLMRRRDGYAMISQEGEKK
jgi:hypothetical protein